MALRNSPSVSGRQIDELKAHSQTLKVPAVLHVPAFDDNYIWLVCDAAGRTAIVDPGDGEPVLAALAAHELQPAAILCTHHHHDHVGGIGAIRARFDVPVYGPAGRIAEVTHAVAEGDAVDLGGGLRFDVIATPGHTRDHIAYIGDAMLFCGDTLFSAGCGRLFEGTPAQMHTSLSRLAELPPPTAVYCGHEYTVANLRFAAAVEPENSAIADYRAWAHAQRAHGRPTLPSTIERELAVNPFLRVHVEAVRQAASKHDHKSDTAADVFGTLRRWKDCFKG